MVDKLKYKDRRDVRMLFAILLFSFSIVVLVWDAVISVRLARLQARIDHLNTLDTAMATELSSLRDSLAITSATLGHTTPLTQRELETQLESLGRERQVEIARARLIFANSQNTSAAATASLSELSQQIGALKGSVADVRMDLAALESETQVLEQNSTTVQQVIAKEASVDRALTKSPSKSLNSPVYNAIFSQKVIDGVAHLPSGKQASLRFYIGSPSLLNALASSALPINPTLLKRKGNTKLDITFICRVCTAGDHQSSTVTLFEDSLSSSEATFAFTPDAGLAANTKLPFPLTIIVEDSGLIYDRIPIALLVDGGGVPDTNPTPLASTLPPEPSKDQVAPPPALVISSGAKTNTIIPVTDPADHALSVASLRPPYEGSETPDLVLRIDPPTHGAWLSLQMVPRNPDLVALLRPLYLAGDVPKWFSTPMYSLADLEEDSADIALATLSVVDKGNPATATIAASVLSTPEADLGTVPSDSIVKPLLGQGKSVYSSLFDKGDPEWVEMAKRLQQFAAGRKAGLPPLRIRIEPGEIAFPWQVLHESLGDAVKEFWGFQYELSIQPLHIDYDTGPDTRLTQLSGAVGLFGTYRATGDESQVVESYGVLQDDHFKKFIHLTDYKAPESKDQFLSLLKQYSGQVQYVLVYAHGSNGYVVSGTVGNHAILPEPEGVRIMFSQSGMDLLRPKELNQLGIGAVGPYLANRPLVLLNACNSGTVTISRAAGGARTFPLVLVNLGSGAVIAPEFPMDSEFAYKFGDSLIEKIGSGERISQALFEVRHAYLNDGSALGLLYTYYGGFPVKVERPAGETVVVGGGQSR